MTSEIIARQTGNCDLTYNGHVIHDRDEMLSLTDMWRAQGGDKSRQPSEWLDSADGKRFCETAVELLNPLKNIKPGDSGFEENQLVITKRGGKTPGTWAHWQIGLAYAKYLSPEFHMWCNSVVRERMEGRLQPALPHEYAEAIQQMAGVCDTLEMLTHKVAGIEGTVQRLGAANAAPTFDLMDTVTSSNIIEMAGVKPHERVKGTTSLVTNAMREFCCDGGCFRTPMNLNASQPWRFPREKAREWLFGECRGVERIRNQISTQRSKKGTKGQIALQLVPTPVGRDGKSITNK